MIHRILTPLVLLLSATCARADLPFNTQEIASFDQPWALAFLPDGRMLVTEKPGSLYVVTEEGQKQAVGGVPDVDFGGQGGLGDVLVHPEFDSNSRIYLSYAEAGVGGTRGAAVAHAELDLEGRRPQLRNVQVIWRQYPKMLGRGHYGHRLLIDTDGYLWITSGDRQKFTPAQDMQSNVGKILRLNDDGSVPEDNPFMGYFDTDPNVDDGGVYNQIWALGSRNSLGIDQAADGRIWQIEMGPLHGDELNLVTRSANYGYPTVSNGDHYDGREMPDHDTRPEFDEPALWWSTSIAPGDLMIYKGQRFTEWQGNAFAAGLGSKAIIRIELLDDGSARELERYDMGQRIRSLTEGPDGAVWVLEDERRDQGGRLLKLTPR
ncbi:PQQ-dependent sugar dehydrogenase [Parahalioglobus pacificus]|uniref:Dehydrogenase n=1 Tax=Parahalioglobus pacificus TaxID=930806 RepID=A0A919CJX4_9GAMM|nr:PQQ-dependent sugar dehydrogenase [Halioglobus pacificus]GHD32167.1 dehydrogenase [Halioglobus pacificus]